MGGLSTPLSLTRMLTIIDVEWLTVAGLAQIHNFLPVFADMYDGAYPPDAIEIGILNSTVCQIAWIFHMPARPV